VETPRVSAAATARPVVHIVVAGEVGGAERMVLSLARRPASDRGDGSSPRRHLIALWTDAPAVRALFMDAGVDVVTPPRPASGLIERDVLRGATGGRDVRWLAQLLRDTGARAAQLHTFASHVLGTRAAVRAGVPVIRTEHSTRVYDHWLCRPFSRWSLRRATAVVAVSDFLRRQICAHVPAVAARVSVVRNGVSNLFANAESAPLAAHAGPLRLGVIARLEPRKGIDQAIAALAAVDGPRLEIVGDGPSRQALERQVAALGIGARVRFWGYRSDPETIISELDAVLCSSRTEGLPVGLLEAMALGRPVIAVPVGGVPEIVADGETGWLAADLSTEALAATLRSATGLGRGEMARRGERARAAVGRRFTEAQMREGYEQIYRMIH
jgi:glycosyltransferase involved in cell wall biosynthesis